MAYHESILWDRAKLDRFKKRYDEAVKNNEVEFEWEGHQFFTRYAFYLIEYLEGIGLR